MGRYKFALKTSAAVAIVLTIFSALVRAQNAQTSPEPALSPTITSIGTSSALGGMSLGATPSIRSADPVLQTAAATGNAVAFEALGPNDFQKFVLETTGYRLALYGQNFFENIQSSQRIGGNPYAPVEASPVTSDYPLGAGDQLVIRGWGAIDIDVRATIDRNGMVTLPRVGVVQMAGVKAGQAEGVLRNAIGKYYKGFELSVTLGQLRAITIYVVGQARRPGSYALSSVSTLASGLFATGGPNSNGSMRHVQLKRGGQVVAELDLYKFLSQGSNATDVKLIDGDVIFIPPAKGHVALVGKVNSPAVYEMKDDAETLEQLLSLAGGVPVIADLRHVTLERLNPTNQQPRSVESLALDQGGLQTVLKNGDLLTIQSIAPEMSNAVALRGNVSQATRLPWREGMRVTDLIPNKEVLISRDSVRRQNEVLFDRGQRERTLREREASQSGAYQGNAQSLSEAVGNLYDEVNWDYAVIERIHRQDLRVTLIPFNLGHVLTDAKDPDNHVLQPGDVVTVFSVNDMRVPLAKRRVFVRLEGEVAKPGIYQATQGETLTNVIERAGGLTSDAYLFGASFYREEVRSSQINNLEKLIRRLEAETSASVAQVSQSAGASSDAALAQTRTLAAQQAQRQAIERVKSLKPEGRIALDLPPALNIETDKLPQVRVQNGDRFVVPSRPDFVYVFGAVNTETALLYKSGFDVADYLKAAGVSQSADRDGVILIRADGTVLTNSGSWSNAVMSSAVMPGDSIVLPEKIDREATWSMVIRNAKDITQILYQLGLGAAAYKVLRN